MKRSELSANRRERMLRRITALAPLEIPIVYVGELKNIEPNVRGVKRKFERGVPKHVPITVANVLLNKGNFKHASEVHARNNSDPKTWARRILVARTLHSIGDMLMASVTPKALKAKYKGARVDVLVPRRSIPLWLHNPWVDSIISMDDVGPGVTRQYDLYFDITRPCVRYEMANHPSKKQRVDIYMEHCGCSLPDEEKQPVYMVTQSERDWAREITGGRFFFGLQLRANAPIRNWMAGKHCPQDRNKEIVKRWLGLNNGVDVLLFDEHQELVKQYDGQRIFKHPGSTIREIFALQERCAIMLTLDSGLLHGCGALTIPVVALFGNIHPASRTTYYKNAVSLFKPECCPSHRAPCNSDCGHQYCLEGITIEEVWTAMTKLWESAGQRRLEIMRTNGSLNTIKEAQGGDDEHPEMGDSPGLDLVE